MFPTTLFLYFCSAALTARLASLVTSFLRASKKKTCFPFFVEDILQHFGGSWFVVGEIHDSFVGSDDVPTEGHKT